MSRHILLGLLTALLAAPTVEAMPDGDYEVSAFRRASTVESEPSTDSHLKSLSAKSASFADSLRWIDGGECAEWSLQPSPTIVIDLQDANLTDVTLGLPTERLTAPTGHFDLICDGKTIAPLVEIDDHVLITASASGATNIVLVKAYEAEEISRLQAVLIAEGLYDGRTSGQLDAETLRAVALYAVQRGAAYAFVDVVITKNLLNEQAKEHQD